MLFLIILPYFLSEVLLFMVYGQFTYKTKDLSTYELNFFKNTMLYSDTNPYITHHAGFSFFSKYYIGSNPDKRVLRFSKFHYDIDKKFKELKKD